MERQPNYFYIAAAMIIDPSHRLLLVRKRNTTKFMLPGGKTDTGETAIETLIRELQEEIALTISDQQAQFLETYETDAANEPNYRIQSQLFSIQLPEKINIEPQAEIEEIIWIEPNNIPQLQYAPLIEEKIFPLWKTFIDQQSKSFT